MKEDGVAAPRGLMPTNYGIGDHFWKRTPGTYLFTTALKFLGRFSVLYLGCLKEILDLGWIQRFHWFFFLLVFFFPPVFVSPAKLCAVLSAIRAYFCLVF